ncbi:MAG: phnB [Ferruginibacter sp.]|nr:phnB [Ferruginibacter sp.]
MAIIHPYIHFNGNAEKAFTFYQSVFGGDFSKLMRYKDLGGTQYPISETDANRLMHIALPLAKNSMLLGSDTMEMMGKVTENDNRNAIFLAAENREEADRLFSKLSVDGSVEMPMADGPFGNYFGMLTDQFGVEWMISFEAN